MLKSETTNTKIPQSLDTLEIEVSENGKTCQRPALHKHWVQRRAWMHYIPLSRLHSSHSSASGRDQWVSVCTEMLQDLEWLLSLPHHCFWSQMVFDPCARAALTSYLELAPRCYDKQLSTLDQQQQGVLSTLHSLVFRVYMRLATIRESETCFLTEHHYGQLLYDNFLLDVPAILDLSLLYGRTAKTQLAQFLDTALRVQPQYAEDLASAAHMFVKALEEVAVFFVSKSANSDKVRLSEQAPGTTGELSASRLEDLTLFLLDIVASMASLLQLLTSAGKIMHPTRLDIEISHFYETVIPEMYRNILSLESDAMCQDLQTKLNTARFYMLDIASKTLGTRVMSIVACKDSIEADVCAEEYLSVLAECLSDPHFISDFHTTSPIDQDLEILRQKCPHQLDVDKYDFLLESVFSCIDIPKPSRPQLATRSEVAGSDEASASTSQVNGHKSHDANPEDLVLESLVSEIQDMLPDLGAGFLQKCLRHYEFHKENVIDAILEDTLPKELKDLDRTMPLPTTADAAPGPSVAVRLNVFDHDEFDVMSRDHIDTSRVHKGKRRSKHRNLSQLLDDKEDLQAVRDMYNQYSTVHEDLYDDEYDDTYDGVNISVDEPEPERRSFVVPRVLAQQRGEREEKLEEEYEEEEEQQGAYSSQENFVQDPALLRAQAEQRRATKLGQHYTPPPSRDVVGKPKGQGQDSSVVHNRKKKDAHKSSQANHNRRAGAQRKMRQGMIPS